ncbi:hypothetical protein CRG98_027372 [Punica granatum]|uniref:Uncharacterized protein n=1 Tax=Punica granatum TaxID=22663 RepID=A0A2I0J7H8_PUNGR|nr:hypothetical protein CRG98_027372 [Punica granatum]
MGGKSSGIGAVTPAAPKPSPANRQKGPGGYKAHAAQVTQSVGKIGAFIGVIVLRLLGIFGSNDDSPYPNTGRANILTDLSLLAKRLPVDIPNGDLVLRVIHKQSELSMKL